MGRRVLSNGEWLALLAVTAISVWHFGGFSRSKPARPQISAPQQTSSNNNMVQSSALLSGLPTGPTIISKEGDPCQKLKETRDAHPPGYGPEFTSIDVKFYCQNASGNYALHNTGIYQDKKLVSSRQERIPDGLCKFVRTDKAPVKPDQDISSQDAAGLEYRTDSFVCYSRGELVLDDVIGVYKNHNPISVRVRARNLASVLQHARKSQ